MSLHPAEVSDEDDHHHGNRQLLIDSRKYAQENFWKSWWQLLVTLSLLAGLVFVVGSNNQLLMRFPCSLLIALCIVRLFIIYHDYMHGAILKGSRFAGILLRLSGHLMLTPPEVWKRTHDHHHHHNSKYFASSIGSFPIMTTTAYSSATVLQRFGYRCARSPILILFGYFTVFLFGMCIQPLFHNPRKNLGAILSLGIHFGTLGLGICFGGVGFTMFAFVLPSFLAMMLGAYLFYIQHNYPEAHMHAKDDWTYADAALDSSSFLEASPLLHWFLGNIGFHHVHHLNSKIPFYRLPEAMRGLPALQTPGRTSFAFKDIAACLRLKLWDSDLQQFVSFRYQAGQSHLK